MDSGDFQSKAVELEKRAAKTMKGSFFGNMMKGKQDRADDAKELYLQAANCYKLQDDMQSALRCYQRCIELEEAEQDAAPHYRAAADCIKESDMDQYLKYTLKAIDQYSLGGRISTGATMAKDAATMMEENYNFEEAIKLYEKAAQLYGMDNQQTQSSQMAVKALDLKLSSKQWDQLPVIINQYQKVAKKYLAIPILKSSAKQFLFMHCLCFLAMDDLVGAKKAIQMNSIEDPSFDGSREMELCQTMVQCIEDANGDAFSVAISEFQNITPLSRSQTSIIVKIKETYLPDQQQSYDHSAPPTDLDFTGAAGGYVPEPAANNAADPPPVDDDNDFV